MKKIVIISFLSLIIFGLNAQVPDYVPTDGLVGWWPFNGNANDESINGNNGVNNGALLVSDRDGNLNSAYSFESGNYYISVPNSMSTQFNNVISVSLWCRIKPTENTIQLISKGIDIENYHFGGKLFSNNDQMGYQFRIRENGAAGVVSAGSGTILEFNEWYNLISIYDGDSLSIYVNGQIVSKINITSTMYNNTSSLYFGASSISYWHNDVLDDIGIWNRALSNCEVLDLYHSQLGSSSTFSEENVINCESYTWNEETYNESGNYIWSGTNSLGCDSTATLNLTINTVNTGISQLDDITLQSLAVGAEYQWIDCETGTPVLGATSQQFTPNQNGDYAVFVTENECSDTSDCISIVKLSLSENQQPSLKIYPNPTTSIIHISSNEQIHSTYQIFDIHGRIILTGKIDGQTHQISIEHFVTGVYTLIFEEVNLPEYRIIKD